MKVKLQYTYEVTVPEADYQALVHQWYQDEGGTHIHYPDTFQEERREVAQWLVTQSQIGNYTELVDQVEYEELEWDEVTTSFEMNEHPPQAPATQEDPNA